MLRYVSTTDARVILEVFKGKRRVAAVPGSAREGRNAIRWNGKAGSRAAAAGVYRLVLRATSGGPGGERLRDRPRHGRHEAAPSTGGAGGGGPAAAEAAAAGRRGLAGGGSSG